MAASPQLFVVHAAVEGGAAAWAALFGPRLLSGQRRAEAEPLDKWWAAAAASMAAVSLLVRDTHDTGSQCAVFGFLVYHTSHIYLQFPYAMLGLRGGPPQRLPWPKLLAGFAVHTYFASRFFSHLSAYGFFGSVLPKLWTF